MGAGWMQCPGPSACSPASQDARKKDWVCEGGEGQGGAASLAAPIIQPSGQGPRTDREEPL